MREKSSKFLRYLLITGLVISSAALSGCKSEPEKELNQVVKTSTFEGVIFTAENAARQSGYFGGRIENYWTPSQADIIALETGLPAFLQANAALFSRQPPVWEQLDSYKRQYLGIMENGTRVVYANYFCQSTLPDWENQFIMVLDGGDCYFQVKFEVDTYRFFDLLVNGEA